MSNLSTQKDQTGRKPHRPAQSERLFALEALEDRYAPAVGISLEAGFLGIMGTSDADEILIEYQSAGDELVVYSGTDVIGRYDNGSVTQIRVDGGAGDDIIVILDEVMQRARIDGGDGNDYLQAGGGDTRIDGGDGDDEIYGGSGNDRIYGGSGINLIFGGPGNDTIVGGRDNDEIYGEDGNDRLLGRDGGDVLDGGSGRDRIRGGRGDDLLDGGAGSDRLLGGAGDDLISRGSGGGFNILVGGRGQNWDLDNNVLLSIASVMASDLDINTILNASANQDSTEILTAAEVQQLLDRATAATSSNDAIVAIVDRNGQILGVRTEAGVSASVLSVTTTRVFAIDGAVAKARTAAWFSSNSAPLTSRTVQFVSQTTITEREVNSNPNVEQDDPNSTLYGPGFVAPIGIGGHFPPNVAFTPHAALFAIEHTNRDRARINNMVTLVNRFNIDPADLPAGVELPFPESFGVVSGQLPEAQPRGVATLPGGIPLYKNGQLVGGIGVFFPGETGYASEENSSLSSDYDPNLPDRSYEAEYIAFAAAGGSSGGGFSIGTLGGVAPVAGFDLPFGRIDLDGITLPIYGPSNPFQGIRQLVQLGQSLGEGTVNGVNQMAPIDGDLTPNGWLVTPHDGVNLTAEEVTQIIAQGVQEANLVRAGIRLPIGTRTSMVLAVTDNTGEVLGMFRMPDATYFSIGVAVAKARNVAYYADPTELQPADQVPGVTVGAALTSRTFRYLAEPRYPAGIEGTDPPIFSILTDGGVDTNTGLNVGPPLPVSAYQSVLGFDAFNPISNFRESSANIANQNGVVFFPGSGALYKDLDGDGDLELVGGLGVSGDGVEQDDVVTAAALYGFEPPQELRADEQFYLGVRLPYLKFNRNPRG